MMILEMSMLRSDIDRAFRVLGAEKGFDQNITDIRGWRADGMITEKEAHELRQYNRVKYHELV